MPTRSSALFSTGVPVSAQLRLREIEQTTSLVELSRFLDPLRLRRARPGRNARPASRSRSRSSNFVVGDPQRDVGQRAIARRAWPGRPSIDHQRHLRRPDGELPLPVRHQRLGADQQHASDLAAAEQQPDGGDRLHRLAQPHLVGQDRRLTRIEERDALELERKRADRER